MGHGRTDTTRCGLIGGRKDGRFISLAFSSDGRQLVTGGIDHAARLWNLDADPLAVPTIALPADRTTAR